MNRKPHEICNFSCVIEMEGLHLDGKSGNILETVQDRDVVATDH